MCVAGRLERGLRAENETLREALAQEQAEPVVWMVYTPDGKSAYVTDNPVDITEQHRALPLYTAAPAPKREPLSEEQISELSQKMVKGNKSVNWLCRAIERAHGIGR